MKEIKKHKPKANSAGQKFIVAEPTELMKFLIESLPGKNRNNIKTLLRDKQVLVDNEAVTQYNHPLNQGQQVEISEVKGNVAKQFHGISIVYEDDYLIVIDKHAGLLAVAAPNKSGITAYSMLSNHVKQDKPSNKIFVVHRLDRETSGLLIYAKSQQIQELLQESWQESVTERTYLAVVEGKMEKEKDTLKSYLAENKAMVVFSTKDETIGKLAITHYVTLKSSTHFSLLKINLETGRKNQIRVQLRDIGHPVVGDKKYGSSVNPIGRVGLHAWILEFVHPVTGEKLRFETSIPRKFERLF